VGAEAFRIAIGLKPEWSQAPSKISIIGEKLIIVILREINLKHQFKGQKDGEVIRNKT
jgi:hypothetical protein